MRNNKPIQVFEHKQLLIGEHGFTKSHWEALGWYNEKHGGCFFSLTPKAGVQHSFSIVEMLLNKQSFGCLKQDQISRDKNPLPYFLCLKKCQTKQH